MIFNRKKVRILEHLNQSVKVRTWPIINCDSLVECQLKREKARHDIKGNIKIEF